MGYKRAISQPVPVPGPEPATPDPVAPTVEVLAGLAGHTPVPLLDAPVSAAIYAEPRPAPRLAGVCGVWPAPKAAAAGQGAAWSASLMSFGIHVAAIALVAAGFWRASPLDAPAMILVELVADPSAPAPRVSLPSPATPPALPADLLPPPHVPLPPPQTALADNLLPPPDLLPPAAPQPLSAALSPPPHPVPVLPRVTARNGSAAAPGRGAARHPRRQIREEQTRKKAIEQQRMARLAAARRARADRKRAAPARRRTEHGSRSGSRAVQPARARQPAGSSPSAATAAAYRALVIGRLARNKPAGEVAELASGTAIVSFLIAPSGAATAIRLAKSAGHGALDRAALATVRRSSPFPRPPPGAGRSFRAPIRFSR